MERTKVKMLTVGYITNSSRDSFKPLLTEMSKTYNIEKFHKEEATFQNIKETLPPKSIILWRILNANQTKAKNLAEKLTEEGHILINPYYATQQSEDKLKTFNILSEHKIPTIPTWECAAGVRIPDNHIVKPRFGTKGENILFGNITHEKIFEPVSSNALSTETYDWIMQPYIPQSNKWLRVLIVNGEPIVAYKRIPPEGRNIANVHQGARREYVKINDNLARVAIKTAKVLGLTIAGIDLTHDPYLVVEANSVPSVPEEAAEKFTESTIKYLAEITQNPTHIVE